MSSEEMGGEDNRIPGCSLASQLGMSSDEQQETLSQEVEGEDQHLKLFWDFCTCCVPTLTYAVISLRDHPASASRVLLLNSVFRPRTACPC